jgi:hypothetical protein
LLALRGIEGSKGSGGNRTPSFNFAANFTFFRKIVSGAAFLMKRIIPAAENAAVHFRPLVFFVSVFNFGFIGRQANLLSLLFSFE